MLLEHRLSKGLHHHTHSRGTHHNVYGPHVNMWWWRLLEHHVAVLQEHRIISPTKAAKKLNSREKVKTRLIS